MFRFLIAAVALLAVTGFTAVSAQEATPTPTPASQITIRFVRDGQPVTLTLGQSIGGISADDVECGISVLPVGVQSSGYHTSWPLPVELGQPFECTKGPPTTLRFRFLSAEAGRLFAEFVWTGSDVTVDAEVPPGFPGVVLPPTGSAPAEDPGEPRWFGLGLMAAGLIAASLGAMTWRLGRR